MTLNRSLSGHPRLVDPETLAPMDLTDGNYIGRDDRRYPIIDGIPRFVPEENYASPFGRQWQLFPNTQLDSYTGIPLSEKRLARCFGGNLEELRGKIVLEAGSGAGRFTEVLLKHGAVVDSFDFSTAVKANAANNGARPCLTLVQADIRHMPFRTATYDFVVCLGVLQHTPDPEESIRALWSRLKPGGVLVFDHYRRKIRNYLPPPLGAAAIGYRWYFLRCKPEKQFEAVKRVFDFWFPVVWRYRRSKAIQFLLSRLTPIVNYYPHFGLRDRETYYEWMLLDTHDAMTDVYKHRRTSRALRHFLESLQAQDIRTAHAGNGVEVVCRKPA